jgi:hypothetical protein
LDLANTNDVQVGRYVFECLCGVPARVTRKQLDCKGGFHKKCSAMMLPPCAGVKKEEGEDAAAGSASVAGGAAAAATRKAGVVMGNGEVLAALLRAHADCDTCT